jgi:hypothetical protein
MFMGAGSGDVAILAEKAPAIEPETIVADPARIRGHV